MYKKMADSPENVKSVSVLSPCIYKLNKIVAKCRDLYVMNVK